MQSKQLENKVKKLEEEVFFLQKQINELVTLNSLVTNNSN